MEERYVQSVVIITTLLIIILALIFAFVQAA